MTARAVRHLPVLEHKKLVGIVSIGDLVKNIIDDKQFIIEQLEHYIQGDPLRWPRSAEAFLNTHPPDAEIQPTR